MALAELIPVVIKDDLDLVVFGNDAWQIEIKELVSQCGSLSQYKYCLMTSNLPWMYCHEKFNKQIFEVTDGGFNLPQREWSMH